MGSEFERLEKEIIGCRRCPRLVEWRERVAREKVRRFRSEEYWGKAVPAFGRPEGALVVIGLAPAAHGGNRTGRMFTGDSSGEWLYEALHRFGFANRPKSLRRGDGLELCDCLVTAVLRCAPPANKPLPLEIENCREFLRRELVGASRKRVIVVLGRIAFDAFWSTWPGGESSPRRVRPVFHHGGEYPLEGGITLIASYHPSRQNTQTGKLTRPMFHRVFCRAREILSA